MKKITFLTLIISGMIMSGFTYGQSYIGHAMDSYSGLHGVLLNPSAVVDTRLRTDINLFSVSAFGGSDYFGTDLTNLTESEDGFNFDENMERFPKDQNQFFANVDVLGPSVMFNLNRKSSIGLTSRVRAFFNLNNINGNLYENISEDFDEVADLNFDLQNFSGTIHAWAEVGLTYGRILVDREGHFIKGGVSLKYLQGAGALFVNAPAASGYYNVETEVLTTAGTLHYGSTPGFDSEDIDFSNLSAGFGADIGFTYEYRPKGSFDSLSRVYSDYKLRLGASVTDIGSIAYDQSSSTRYNLDNAVHADIFRDHDLETVLEEQYEGQEEFIEARINLPTALHLYADYRIDRRFYVSLRGSLSLIGEDSGEANRIINSITAAPRLQSRWFSLYLPVSLRQYDGLAMGAGLRLGPLSVGSGSIISNYISDSSKTTDVFVGLKIPVYR